MCLITNCISVTFHTKKNFEKNSQSSNTNNKLTRSAQEYYFHGIPNWITSNLLTVWTFVKRSSKVIAIVPHWQYSTMWYKKTFNNKVLCDKKNV